MPKQIVAAHASLLLCFIERSLMATAHPPIVGERVETNEDKRASRKNAITQIVGVFRSGRNISMGVRCNHAYDRRLKSLCSAGLPNRGRSVTDATC